MTLVLIASLAVEVEVLVVTSRWLRRRTSPSITAALVPVAALLLPVILAPVSASPVGSSRASLIPFIAVFGLYAVWAVRFARERATIRRRQEGDASLRPADGTLRDQGPPMTESSEVLYRTPGARRLTVIGLVVLDVAVLEAVLQTMSAIPAVVQGLVVVLSAGTLFGLAMAVSSFVTVRGGRGWVAVHRFGWSCVYGTDLTSDQMLGPSPRFCSIVLRDRLGQQVRLGAWAAKSPRVREHVRQLLIEAVEVHGYVPSAPTCAALGVEPAQKAIPDRARRGAVTPQRLVLTTVVMATTFGAGMKWAFQDTWAPPVAMGTAAAALAAAFFWWVTAPARWGNE